MDQPQRVGRDKYWNWGAIKLISQFYLRNYYYQFLLVHLLNFKFADKSQILRPLAPSFTLRRAGNRIHSTFSQKEKVGLSVAGN